MKNILLKSLSAFTILSMSFMSNIAVAQEAFVEEGLVGNNEGNQIWICHATSSENNPYNAIQVNENGLNGHGDHEDDIIPITDMDNDQDIDDDDCSLAVGTDQDEDNNDCDQPSLTQDEEGDCDDDGCDQQDTPSIDNNEDCDDQEDGGGCDEQQDSIVDDNEDDCDDEDCPQVEGILVDEGGNDDCDDDEEQVCVEGNLIENGGFENPDVSSSGWSIYNNGTSGLGWDVEWNGSFVGAPEVAKLEIHDNYWTPVAEGTQYAELDTDWGYNENEQASVVISQDVPTISGQNYVLAYDFSPRPGTVSADNMLEVWVNGSSVENHSADGSANSGTAWTHYEYEFTATGPITTIAFKDMGTPNSLGTLLDNVSLNCGDDEPEEEDEPSCDSNAIWARVVITNYTNTGVGDMTDDVFVGSDSSSVNSGEWFMVHDGTNAIVDPTLYEDVPGFSVQRQNGKLYAGLHGSHPGTAGQVIESVDGYIEFWNGDVTNVAGDLIQNKLDNPDKVWISGNRSYFDLQINTGDDFYYTDYSYNQDENCDEGPSCDVPQIWARVVLTSFSNVGAGDMTDTIYLGSDSNTVASGEWFNTEVLDAASIEDFADVEGLAVKRAAGKIVLELHGSHNPQGTGQEYADGYIEFFHGVPTTLVGATGQNKLESEGDAEIGHEDIVWIDADKAYFNLGVGTADDRFTTNYSYSEDESCDDEPENPECEVDCGPVEPNCEELQNCEDNEEEVPQNPNNNSNNDNSGPKVTSSGSFGGGGGGQVLGAKTKGDVLGACVPFTEYHKKGDVGGEIPRLQEFLNDELGLTLEINGIFDEATFKAVKAFQQKYFDQTIKPWVPWFPSRTTGKVYKTTLSTINEVIGCPQAPVFLEDPQILFQAKINKTN